MEQIIRAIRSIRDRQIDELLDDSTLLDFLEHNFSTFAISQLKVAFLKKDLAELRNSPLDLSYYSSLIKQKKESNNTKPLEDHPLFRQELTPLFQKYLF